MLDGAMARRAFEHMGGVAATCLRHPLVASVDVTVHKPDARLPVSLTDVSVTLTRSRP